MHPWGVAEARALRVYDDLLRNCERQTRWWITYAGGVPMAKRDLQETSPQGVGSFNLYHPQMQEQLDRVDLATESDEAFNVSVRGLRWGHRQR